MLSNKFTMVSLLALLLISYGMVAFHMAEDIPGIMMSETVALMNVYLLFQKKEKIAPLIPA